MTRISSERAYDKWKAYGQSKTANALFALALDARGETHRVRAFSVHPGAVHTELTRFLEEEELRAILASPRNTSTTFKTTAQGAATSVWCAASRQLDGMGGIDREDVDVAEAVAADFPAPSGVRPWAMDPGAAERLWMKSEEWTGRPLCAGQTARFSVSSHEALDEQMHSPPQRRRGRKVGFEPVECE